MKICFVAWSDFGIGGVPKVLTCLMDTLSRNHDVSLYSLKNLPQSGINGINREQIHIYCKEMNLYEKVRRSAADILVSKTPLFSSALGCRLYAAARYTSGFKKALTNHLNKHQYDVVIFGSGFEDSLLLALTKKKLLPSMRIMTWSHASYDNYFTNMGSFFARYMKEAIKAYYHRFDEIIVLSDGDEKEFKEKHHLPARRIYNPNTMKPAGKSSLTSKTFVYVGALSRQKGTDLAVRAFRRFIETDQEWNLHIYGDGPLKGWIEEYVSSHGLGQRIILHGPNGNMVEEFPRHSILVFPSRCEGFGLVQVEAMCCGLPILAADIPICREIVGKHHAGIFFESDNPEDLCRAMREMTASDLSTYAANGLAAAPLFNLEQTVSEWENMFNAVKS